MAGLGPRSGSRRRVFLDEAQREAIALADGCVFRAVLVAQAVSGRQGPDSVRIILGVFGVGVYLRFAGQLEASGFDLFDRPSFRQVTELRALDRIGADWGSVIFDPEHAL